MVLWHRFSSIQWHRIVTFLVLTNVINVFSAFNGLGLNRLLRCCESGNENMLKVINKYFIRLAIDNLANLLRCSFYRDNDRGGSYKSTECTKR